MISVSIHINTESGELSATEKAIMAVLSGSVPASNLPASAFATDELKASEPPRVVDAGKGDEVRAEAKAEVAKKTAARKPAAKVVEPEPADEPADEPIPAHLVPGPLPEPADEPEPASSGSTLEDAVAAASALLSSGKSAEVKSILTDFGVKRVSELKGATIGEFISALATVDA